MRIDVLPAFRREGIGTALLNRLVAAAVAGEHPLLATTIDERSAAVAVLPRWRFQAEQLDQLSRLATAELDRALLSSWLQGSSTEYELLRIDGRLPNDLLEACVTTRPRPLAQLLLGSPGLRSEASASSS